MKQTAKPKEEAAIQVKEAPKAPPDGDTAPEVRPEAATPSDGAVSAANVSRRDFPKPPPAPVLEGPKGLRYDFNDGCRIFLPVCDQPWTARLRDLDTGNILFETTLASGRINSSKRYYVRIRI